MQVKRFVAPNMRLALKMVREEMGPEAVILSSKRLENGVEILTSVDSETGPSGMASAAANDNPFKPNPFQAEGTSTSDRQPKSRLERELEEMQRSSQRRARELADSFARKPQEPATVERRPVAESTPAMPAATASTATMPTPTMPAATMERYEPAPDVVSINQQRPVAAEPSKVEGEVAELRSELQSMRDMLEQQLSSMAWGSYRQQNPKQASLWRRMKRMGLSASVCHGLLDKLPVAKLVNEKERWRWLMTRLAQQLPVDSSDVMDRGGVYVFVGPTGAGKTTTIGKLATRYVLQHGADEVALVTTDTARIAAYEQLRTFGRILNVPVKVVEGNTGLERVLYSLRHKKLVLVDTAGFSAQDGRLQQQINMLNEMAGRVKTILTLPATSQKHVIKAAYHTYKADNLAGCVITKLDETSSVGEVLSLVTEKRLPVLYSTHGQGVPDHIQVADARHLVQVAIGLAKQVATDDGTMADEIGILAGA